MTETCETCKFRDRVSDDCRRFPPRILQFERGSTRSQFPRVERSDWCGEYKERTDGSDTK
jgi:hypothetical protein